MVVGGRPMPRSPSLKREFDSPPSPAEAPAAAAMQPVASAKAPAAAVPEEEKELPSYMRSTSASRRSTVRDVSRSLSPQRSLTPDASRARAMSRKDSSPVRRDDSPPKRPTAKSQGDDSGLPSYARATSASKSRLDDDDKVESPSLSRSASRAKSVDHSDKAPRQSMSREAPKLRPSTASVAQEPAKTEGDLPSYARATSASRSKLDGGNLPSYARPTSASKSRDDDDDEEPRRRAKSVDSKRVSMKAPAPATAAEDSKRASLKAPATAPALATAPHPEMKLQRGPSQIQRPKKEDSPTPPARPVQDLSIYEGCEDPIWSDEGESDDLGSDRHDGPRGTYQPRTNNYFHRPSSVARLGANPDVAEFVAWVERVPHGWEDVHEIFTKESANPAGGEHHGRGSRSLGGLSRKCWVRLLMNHRYPNEAGLNTVFDEVAKEVRTDKAKKAPITEMQEGRPVEQEITLPQLKRFERRAKSVNATLIPQDKNSPASRFLEHVKNKFGTTLLAWMTVIDKHKTGRVGYADFINGCRDMGMQAQGKLVWDNVKRDQVSPLELHDLDPEEGKNLEEFAERMWDTVGMDLTKAWNNMDVHEQHVLAPDQFKAGAVAYGFEGDAKLLYRGLDGSRLGRLKQDEFKYILKVSRAAQRRFGAGNQVPKGALSDLLSWCQREFGSVDEFTKKIGFPEDTGITVVDLAARLTALGFESDSLECASKAAHKEGGTMVTKASLNNLLSRNKRTADNRTDQPPKPPGSPGGSNALQYRSLWNSGIDDISDQNRQRCKYDRGYFEEKKLTHPLNVALKPSPMHVDKPSNTELARKTPGLERWQTSYFPNNGDMNEEVPAVARKYFDDPAEHPVRDLRRALVQDRIAARAQKENENSSRGRQPPAAAQEQAPEPAAPAVQRMSIAAGQRLSMAAPPAASAVQRMSISARAAALEQAAPEPVASQPQPRGTAAAAANKRSGSPNGRRSDSPNGRAAPSQGRQPRPAAAAQKPIEAIKPESVPIDTVQALKVRIVQERLAKQNAKQNQQEKRR